MRSHLQVEFETPSEVISRIRTKMFIDEDLDQDGNAERILEMMKTLERSIVRLAEDINSKVAHFVSELLQNADDKS